MSATAGGPERWFMSLPFETQMQLHNPRDGRIEFEVAVNYRSHLTSGADVGDVQLRIGPVRMV
jgi:hypothetical protein